MNLGDLLVRAPGAETPPPTLGEDLKARDLLMRAPGAETPPPTLGEEKLVISIFEHNN